MINYPEMATKTTHIQSIDLVELPNFLENIKSDITKLSNTIYEMQELVLKVISELDDETIVKLMLEEAELRYLLPIDKENVKSALGLIVKYENL